MPKCPICGEENPQLGAKCPRDEGYYIYEDALRLAETDPRIGTLAADKYVIVGRISKGGMGAVYRAIQMPVEREIAFKVLRTEMEDSDQGRDRFIREARAVSKLTHPNIITLHDFGFEASGHPYMVMEYAPGKDLGTWIRTEQVTTQRVAHVLRQLLSALEEAHLQGIVHRDLKPENMIVTSTASDPDFVKLLDFGIARLINETNTKGLTREGEVFGTPHYMAPEQAQGAKEVGPAADIYAVGIMMYEMLTGDAPYDAPTPLAVLLMHINEPLPQVVPRPGVELDPMMLKILEKATVKDQNVRYQNATEMLHDFDHWMAQYGLGSTTGTFRSPMASTPGAPSPYHNRSDPSSSTESGLISLQGSASPVSIHDPDATGSVPKHMPTVQDFNGFGSDTISDMGSAEFEVQQNNKKPLIMVGLLALIIVVMGVIAVVLATSAPPSEGPTVVKNQTTPPDKTPDTEPVKTTVVAEKKDPSANNATTPSDAQETAPKTTPEPVNNTAAQADNNTTETAAPDKPEPDKTVASATNTDKVSKKPKRRTPKRRDPKSNSTKEPKTPAKQPDKTPDPPPVKKPPKKNVEAWSLPTTEDRKKQVKDDKW